MKNNLLLLILFLSLTACAGYEDISFESMNEAELLEYNRGRPLSQMIVCSENDRSFSRVRRRRCATVEAMYGSVQQAEQLGVLNQIQGIGPISGN